MGKSEGSVATSRGSTVASQGSTVASQGSTVASQGRGNQSSKVPMGAREVARRKKKKKTEPANNRIAELWKEYKREPTKKRRNELMVHYLPLVKRTAERVHQKLPNSIEVGDLINSGVFGLRDAIRGFDLERGVKFTTYCTTRIRGAILDELRSIDWVPRLVRSKAHKLQRAIHQLEVELGRDPTERELASRLGLSHKELDSLVNEARAVSVVSLSEQWPQQDDDPSQLRKIDVLEDRRQQKPIDFIQRKDVLELVTRGLKMKERLIVLLYYFEKMTMREIGLTLDLSESRVCQLHSRIMKRLREQLGRVKTDIMGR